LGEENKTRGANIVTLKRQRSIYEGDWEVVKRSGRDESVQAVIHMCMEAMLGISLYNYLYLKLAKTRVFCIISYVFSSTNLEKSAEQVLRESEGGRGQKERVGEEGGRNGPHNACTCEYMNKKRKLKL
jgi:hypothetical protein